MCIQRLLKSPALSRLKERGVEKRVAAVAERKYAEDEEKANGGLAAVSRAPNSCFVDRLERSVRRDRESSGVGSPVVRASLADRADEDADRWTHRRFREFGDLGVLEREDDDQPEVLGPAWSAPQRAFDDLGRVILGHAEDLQDEPRDLYGRIRSDLVFAHRAHREDERTR